jgi:uncharacterized membrane protein
VASFGGSWTFVGLFAATMLVWVLLNAFLVMSSLIDRKVLAA